MTTAYLDSHIYFSELKALVSGNVNGASVVISDVALNFFLYGSDIVVGNHFDFA